MSDRIEDYFYDLPPEQIAQASVQPRDHSRLMTLDRVTGEVGHHQFYDLPRLLRSGDVLVFNDTKVFRARLMAKTGVRAHEVFLLRPDQESTNASVWRVLVYRARKLRVRELLQFADGVAAEVVKTPSDPTGEMTIRFNRSVAEVFAFCEAYGSVPKPPYVNADVELDDYQTSYAKTTGSVAAPTSGFHFTERTFADLKEQGVEVLHVTLHVGLGTFQPVKTETLSEHPMHAEWVDVRKDVAERLRLAKAEGRRVVAVGTTVARTLEGVHAVCGSISAYSGEVNVFITPGFHFQVVDALVTNFHLPQSTLLALVSAFAGRESVLRAYEQAVQTGYRFFSFGDAMFLQ